MNLGISEAKPAQEVGKVLELQEKKERKKEVNDLSRKEAGS